MIRKRSGAELLSSAVDSATKLLLREIRSAPPAESVWISLSRCRRSICVDCCVNGVTTTIARGPIRRSEQISRARKRSSCRACSPSSPDSERKANRLKACSWRPPPRLPVGPRRLTEHLLGAEQRSVRTGCLYFLSRGGSESGHQRRLEIDFTSIAPRFCRSESRSSFLMTTGNSGCCSTAHHVQQRFLKKKRPALFFLAPLVTYALPTRRSPIKIVS